MAKRIAFQTLGCRLNQHETDALAAKFTKAGYEIVPFKEEADVYLINTCSVTGKSDRKSRNIINRARRESDALVVVTGCYVDGSRDKLEEDGRTYIIENDKKAHIFELVDSYFSDDKILPSSVEADRFGFSADENPLHTRALVKIQDGCENFCTYCIIPYVRGKAVSRDLNEIVEQTEQLIESGFHEVVLTGINISRYSFEDFTFADVVERILELDGDFRLHIPSMEPENVSDKFIELLKHPKLCQHIHLCLQSGNDRILKAMNRKYDTELFLNVAKRIREINPLFNFTTDLIVGFPGETDEEFESSINVCKEVEFGHIHTFKYSKREGTPAAKMKEQVDEKIKTARSEQIRQLNEELKLQYRQKFIGETQRVLVEKIKDGVAKGYSQYYLPVQFECDDSVRENSFVDVVVKGIENVKDEPILSAVIS